MSDLSAKHLATEPSLTKDSTESAPAVPELTSRTAIRTGETSATGAHGAAPDSVKDWLTDFVALRLLSKPWKEFPQVVREGPLGLQPWLDLRGLSSKRARLGRDKGGRILFTLENSQYESNELILQRYRLVRAFADSLPWYHRDLLRELVLANEQTSRRWGEGVTPEEVQLLMEICRVKQLKVPQVRLGFMQGREFL